MQRITIAFAAVAALAASPALAADSPPHLDTSGVNMQPAYPASALAGSERGAAVVGVNVSGTGTVNYAWPLQTSGFNDLDSAAIAGVLGWRFIPATSNGMNFAGDAVVEIVFQPPDPPNGNAKTPADPPRPAGDFLAKTFEIEAKRGEYEQKVEPALCPNGMVKTTMEFLHTEGPAASRWRPAAALIVRGDRKPVEQVALFMIGVEYITPPEERFIMEQRHGNQTGGLNYSHAATFNKPETVSLSWDSTGLVTATVGALEKHQARLTAPPSTLVFSMSSGATKFTDSALLCRSGAAS